MTQDEIQTKIDELQATLNQVNQQLLNQSPQAQNLIGQIAAYNQMLDEPRKTVTLEGQHD